MIFTLFKKNITLGIWSIKVLQSNSLIFQQPKQERLINPTIKASDINDVPAEFIADPFIISHNEYYYMFFEVLDKSSGKGIIGFAKSKDGEQWNYEKIILKEKFHLSYPYVFKYKEEIYMIPESSEAGKVILYKAKNFPYTWEKEKELLQGNFVDSSIFQYQNRWWMFATKSGKLHLFYSEKLDGEWQEHVKSPLISNNRSITRPGGRVIVDGENIYRYTQDGEPSYGSAIRVFKINHLSKHEYEEDEVNLILKGTGVDNDWRKDGMHTIDQLKITEDKWLIAVDGHRLVQKNYLIWKLESSFVKILVKLKGFKSKLSN